MKSMVRFKIAFAILYMVAIVSQAQPLSYARVRIFNGPVLEYPSHWRIVDDSTVQNRMYSSQATMEATGIDTSNFQKSNRLIIQSVPFPSAAQIRASIVTPPQYTQEALRAATSRDLEILKNEFEETVRKISLSGPVKFHKVSGVRVEKIADKFALIISYTRYTASDPVLWEVEQIKIPYEDRMLSMTISYRTSDLITMLPILERVKRTLVF